MGQRRRSKARKGTNKPKPSEDDVEELPSRRGGGKPWTSLRQSKFLEARAEAFEDARQTPKKVGLKSFWCLTIQDFLKEWPQDVSLDKAERDDEVAALTERVKTWYNNHCRSTAAKSGKKAIIDFSNKKKRHRSHVHTYSVHFGDLRIVPILTECWKKHKKCLGSGSPVPLWFRNEVTKEAFDDESKETKEEVARLREEDLGDFDDDDDDDGEYQYLLEEEGVDAEELERRQKMIELQRNISALPNTIINILEQVREQTGFMGVCAFFGSEPKASGNITAYTSSVGETAAGTTIEEYIEGFKMDFEDQLVDFGCEVITESEHAELCMPGMEGKKNYGPRKRPDSRVGSNGPSTKKRGWGSNLRKIATLKAAASCISSMSSRQMERRKRNRDSDSEDNNLPVNTAFDDDDDSTHGEDTADKEKEKLAGGEEEDTQNDGEAAEVCQPLLDILASTEEEMPEWLSSTITYLYKPTDLWVDTLRAFIKFEEALGFPCAAKGVHTSPFLYFKDSHHSPQAMYRLSSLCRPSALSQFINSHRNKEPTINNVEVFTDELYVWWISLQPPSRRDDRDTSVSDSRSLVSLASEVATTETWEDLRKGSINGVFGVLCCLGWWLRMDGPLASDDLLDLIQDVSWVLQVMSDVSEEALVAARKRKAEEEEATPRKKA
ncbi:hypothetical protein BDN71DRAFT_1432062 [Pleurotus eryngii]|uniref:Uncharacterized protein n=1 Tax=Pleurotus eryngii TaxID=5323 RepID=A0A9P6DFN9_PLEER|nr:hypothetical protein BDN71DRAFT_1432062 [Pleurotus eryngii]